MKKSPFPDITIRYPPPIFPLIPGKQILEVSVVQDPPALLGEFYPIAIHLSQSDSYHLANILIKFNGPSHSDNAFTILDNKRQELPNNELIVDTLNENSSVTDLYVQFREEGKKRFSLAFKYTGRKKLRDGSESKEFVLEDSCDFSVEIKPPFAFTGEWTVDEDCVKCEALRSKELKNSLVVGQTAIASTKITAMTSHLSLIHICRCRRYAVCRSRWSPYH
eukprot:TRINITY_DN19232_c0_g1_i1.p1 TRINITY_DN19232_c0_g1~~TRINITY_DN19232_c0_g1_i1.p1  ORF type:complete len:221 (-),score=30.04 TRINITY_DN19232_c0_g1_i1:10-672(-)